MRQRESDGGERGDAQTEYILLAVLIALAVIAVILPR
jgi:Flp pilus assembly pilin Flp